MFKTREILKAALRDVKKNFWMYLAVVLIFGVISGFSEGATQIFANINKIIMAARNNMLTSGIIGNPSTAPNMLLGTTALAGGMGIFGVLISIFLLNPLQVGVNKFFVEGIENKPKWETLISSFTNKYMNVVGIMLLKGLLLGVITFALSFVFLFGIMICASIIAFIFGYLKIASDAVRIASVVLCIVVALAMFIAYLILSISIGYNFSMINYIVSEKPEIGFSECYALSKQMVKGNKMKIFKVDFVYSLIVAIVMLVPCSLMIVGAIVLSDNDMGIVILLAGLLAIIPALFVSLFVSLFQNAAWANMYCRLKKPEEKEKIPEEENVYAAPQNRQPISYAPHEGGEEENDE